MTFNTLTVARLILIWLIVYLLPTGCRIAAYADRREAAAESRILAQKSTDAESPKIFHFHFYLFIFHFSLTFATPNSSLEEFIELGVSLK